MIVKELGSFILFGSIIIAAIIGVSSRYFTHKNDSVVEEITEEFIESQIEKALDLKDDSINIDLSPGEEVKNV